MQPAMIHISFLEERRRLGHDKFDEVWDGVLHMVPQPTPIHQSLESRLKRALDPIAMRRDLICLTNTGLYNPSVPGHEDYRAPDLVIARRDVISRRGIEGAAEIAIEIRSPDDESYDKLPFYASVGVREVWIIDPLPRTIEVYAGTRRIEPVGGVIHAAALGLELAPAGSVLNIKDGAQMYDVDISDVL